MPSLRFRYLLYCFAFIAICVLGTKRASSSSLRLASAVFTSAVAKQSLGTSQKASEKSEPMKIGGQRVVQLKRKASRSPDSPEFLSATILPGRGMNLFQITAKLPGKGIVNVLASPSLDEAAASLNDGPDDLHGVHSFAFGGAFLTPYPNRIRGTLTPDGKEIVTQWNGKPLSLPAVWKGKANPHAELHAIHGLILDRKTDELKVRSGPDGQSVTGTIHGGDFGGHWISSTDLIITVTLTGTAVEASITAKNVGAEPEPIGIGWHPYFTIPSGDRKQARLQVPASELAEVNNYDDVFPTGKLIAVQGTKYDFTAPGGRPLAEMFLDDNFSHLARPGDKVTVDLIDPSANYGLHIQGLSKDIKTVQVYAPPEKPYVAIEEQFNFADPFSAVWGNRDTGMVALQPGSSVNWRVRLELFTPAR